MSKAFLTEGSDWDFCAEKGVSCVYAIAGMARAGNAGMWLF